MNDAPPLDRIGALLAAVAELHATPIGVSRVIAVGWATVELDRAAAELGAQLGIPVTRFQDAVPSLTLGARCRVAPAGLPNGIGLVLLEPSTEGRLAATLARHAEGPAVVWLAVPGLATAEAAARTGALKLSVTRVGPFGAERAILDGPVHGPHRLLVLRGGTIDT